MGQKKVISLIVAIFLSITGVFYSAEDFDGKYEESFDSTFISLRKMSNTHLSKFLQERRDSMMSEQGSEDQAAAATPCHRLDDLFGEICREAESFHSNVKSIIERFSLIPREVANLFQCQDNGYVLAVEAVTSLTEAEMFCRLQEDIINVEMIKSEVAKVILNILRLEFDEKSMTMKTLIRNYLKEFNSEVFLTTEVGMIGVIQSRTIGFSGPLGVLPVIVIVLINEEYESSDDIETKLCYVKRDELGLPSIIAINRTTAPIFI
jgi:hypothetical protein